MSAPSDPRPRLCVLVPCHNGRDGLLRTLVSLDAQQADFDVLVVDDGSTPPLDVDPAGYRHRVEPLRLPVNRGIEEALNTGLEVALTRGYEFIARQDAGDTDMPHRLARQIAFLDAHPEVAFVGGWAQFVGKDGRPAFLYAPPADPAAIARRMRYKPAFVHPALMLRTSALRRAGPYALGYARAEDYELCFRLIASGARGANLPEVLVIKEDDPLSLSNAKRARQIASRLKVQWRYFDRRDVHAWAGLAYSAALYLAPVRLLAAAKRAAGAVR